MTDLLPVSDADREAARPWLHQYINGTDLLPLAEAFARHRITVMEEAAKVAKTRHARPKPIVRLSDPQEEAFAAGMEQAGINIHDAIRALTKEGGE